MPIDAFPEWLKGLEEEDLRFVRLFLLASGSLKDMAAAYEVSYPTVRARLDRLIAKIQAFDQAPADPFVALVRGLAIEGRIDPVVAKTLIRAYRKRGPEP